MDHFDHRGFARPRSLVVIVGGMIACSGLVWGLAVTTDAYHRALTMGQLQELTWDELVEHGLFDNAHVRLTEVQLDSGVRFQQLRHSPSSETAWPLIVAPRGLDVDEIAPLVTVDADAKAVESASDEVHRSSSLTGRFRPVRDESVRHLVTRLLKLPVAPRPSYTEAQFVFEPAESVLPPNDAKKAFYASVLLTAVGLVICGSGAPSPLTSVLWCIPSVLSVGGYPLRYGRGNVTMSLFYLLGGCGLIYFAHEQLFDQGRIQLLAGEPGKLAIGFLMLTAGTAACLGAVTSVAATRYGFSSWRARWIPEAEPQDLSDRQAKPRYSRRYVDPKFTIATEVDREAPYLGVAEIFETIDFESPLVIEVVDDDEVIPTTIQVGCCNMALAVVEVIDEDPLPRLVSILDDGFAILTIAKGAPHEAEHRAGSTGTYQVAPSNDPVTLLSCHLDFIAAVAEERGSTVITVSSNEWREIYLFAHRVLAEIRHRHGEADRSPEDAMHGRFCFPIHAVEKKVACGV